MGDPEMELCILDEYNAIDAEPITVDELLHYWKDKLSKREHLLGMVVYKDTTMCHLHL